MYIARRLEARISGLLSKFPAIAVTGPRQSGKSTMLRKSFSEGRVWINFDDPTLRGDFHDDPRAFMARMRNGAVIDEAQKVPEIFEYLKMEIDDDRTPGRFILTGSSQFGLTRGMSESLAGRIAPARLLPFEWTERETLGTPRDAMLYGNYPEIVLGGGDLGRDWFPAYMDTYLMRDVRSVRNIGNERDFLRCIQLLAGRCAQELNMSVYARELGVSEKTIQAWLSVLEAGYIIFLVPAYHQNYGKRIIKRPKLYFWDTGLVNNLAGVMSVDQLEKGPLAGPVFENYIASEMYKAIAHAGTHGRLYWFRSGGGLEVDFIHEDHARGRLDFIEVKRGTTPRIQMFAGLKRILADHKALDGAIRLDARGILVYQGETVAMGEDLLAVNYLEFFRTWLAGDRS
ncbi:MAG: AAA family ATPase [Spirochaetae bacterium HGW-Spirochaetae-7]|jgi:hypothetical protein|nr:MAG: AAA family ATPase [Spirochaetae bacterium HGW-Spirochaetae-7]